MTPENFCYWLRGYLELCGETKFSPEQTKMVKAHLDLVMQESGPVKAVRETCERQKPKKTKSDFALVSNHSRVLIC